MPQLIVTQPFLFAHGGHTVEEFAAASSPRETTAEVLAWAVQHGYGLAAHPAPDKAAKPEGARSRKAHAAAPEVK